MTILIDTHIFLWSIGDPGRLGEKRRLSLENRANRILVSALSIAELTMKASLGKLELNFEPVEASAEAGVETLPFTAEAAMLLKDLPFHHKDPFDRMIIAQAILGKHPVMSDDSFFRFYPIKVI